MADPDLPDGATKAGFITKCGGAIKTWRKRYLVLNGDTLYYYKKKDGKDPKGEIKLMGNETIDMAEKLDIDPDFFKKSQKKSKHIFGIKVPKRTYLMFGASAEDSASWLLAIREAQKKVLSRGGPARDDSGKSTEKVTPTEKPVESKEKPADDKPAEDKPKVTPAEKAAPTSKAGVRGGKVTTREHLTSGKKVIPFLTKEKSQTSEFWEIWLKNIPAVEELTSADQTISFQVSTSADMQKLTWRTSGPQSVFIQKMVDFFYIVGAPETEIDRLNDVGALINPVTIGSWIDMSAKGGIDGGWYFPVEISLKLGLEAADDGAPIKAIREWASKHSVERCQSVGRDMGAEPPRQTELRIEIPGEDFKTQLEIVLDAIKSFGFPDFPKEPLDILRKYAKFGLALSINTSSEEEFVRIGLLSPEPSTETVLALCELLKVKHGDLAMLEGFLSVLGPAWVEFQYLKEPFGYNVYKEGFDIVFHYDVGSESKLA